MSTTAVEPARYCQISTALEKQIATGELAVGRRLPAEHELGRRFGVNRHTVREALRRLKDEGLVYSLQGRGTFVARNKVPYRVSNEVRFSAAILEAADSILAALAGQPPPGAVNSPDRGDVC